MATNKRSVGFNYGLALMDNPHFVRLLSGHSGCVVELLKQGSDYFVRKSAPSSAYSLRLARQAEKQRRLRSLLPLPKILASSGDEEAYWFEMEYIQGLDFKQFCLSKPITYLPGFLLELFGYLESLAKNPYAFDLTTAFTSKVESLQNTLSGHASLLVRSLASRIQYLRNYDFSSIPCTDCHGDMTLENLIFKSSGEFFFIDTLDGELESVWMDIAKLIYDVEISWTLRRSLWRRDHSPEHRLLTMIARYLSEEINNLVELSFPNLVPHLPALKTLQALRVLPYSTDELTIARLVNYIEATLPQGDNG